jgi:hypothetical protein
MLVEYIDLRFANKIVVKPLPDIKTVQKTVANKDAEVKPNKKKQHDKRKKKKK